jgi:hypothetical protein
MKLLVFLPIIIFFTFFGLLVAGFLLLVLKIVKKTATSSWTGEVTDKLYNTDKEDNKVSQFFTLVVKTDEGLTRKIAVSQSLYDSCQVGDKLVKPKGALNPQKA